MLNVCRVSGVLLLPEQLEIKVRLFALARQLANCDTLSLTVPERATVSDVRRGLVEACPALTGLMSQMLVAVNSEYASDETPVPLGSEVAVIPPVSGG